MAETFYWHDYETFGLKTRLDRPVQFAGQRTDAELKPIGEGNVWYCEASCDYLPDPTAVFVTGITPQLAHEKGAFKEVEFAGAIHSVFTVPETISVGYNNFSFDDEVTRHLFWRNLMDVYGREYANHCSRWDLFPFTLAVWALRPEGICWPEVTENGLKRPSFRLEHLSQANHLTHTHAHDAMSDVEATIELARLFVRTQPKLWAWALGHRSKEAVEAALDTGHPVVWIDRSAGFEKGFIRCVMPLCASPRNKKELIVWDCREDPTELLGMDPEIISRRAWGRKGDLLEGEARLSLRRLKVNAAPFVCSDLRILTPSVCERFQIDLKKVVENGEKLTHLINDLAGPVSLSFKEESAEPVDADAALYSKFIDYADQAMLSKVHSFNPQQLKEAIDQGRLYFDDERLKELLFRMRARNWPETLNEDEKIRWQAFCHARLQGHIAGTMSLSEYFEEIDKLATENEEALADGSISEAEHDRRQQLCETLYAWGEYVGELSSEGLEI